MLHQNAIICAILVQEGLVGSASPVNIGACTSKAELSITKMAQCDSIGTEYDVAKAVPFKRVEQHDFRRYV